MTRAEERALLESAAHWQRLATDAERRAAYDREQGRDLSAPGHSAGDHRARTWRRVSRRLRAAALTGVYFCDCDVPETKCRKLPPHGWSCKCPVCFSHKYAASPEALARMTSK